ncbi:MAG TPA: TatD family hydrolase [Candidatus Krumholzibacteria bacterium]|nr:TatD family hydrolase [Candidatus Krumholzibacteria bacterium]
MQPASIPDAHCHLDLIADPERAIEEALAAGVGPLLAVGTEQASSERVLELRGKYPGSVLAAVGLHPSEIPALSEAELAAELEFVAATLPQADALGEVGLDFRDAQEEGQRARQRQALEQQLEWASRHRKPVSAHSRRAEHEMVERMGAFVQKSRLRVNLHWFTHSEKLVQQCGRLGIYISPGPSILHSEPQAAVARCIDAAHLLLETDSPVEFQGQPARPVWAVQVAERLAALRGVPAETLATLLQENFRRYLGG